MCERERNRERRTERRTEGNKWGETDEKQGKRRMKNKYRQIDGSIDKK